MPGAVPPKKEWPGLATTLAGLDDEQLTRLLSLRPDLVRPAPRDMAGLAARAGTWPGARDCYHNLDHAAQRVVEALCLLPRPTVLADVAALLGVPTDDADLAAALVRLEERALAFRLDGDAGAATIQLLPALAQVDYPARLGPSVAPFLRDLSGPALDQMAQRLGAKPAKIKPDTLALIISILSDPAEVGPLVERGPVGTVDLARRAAAEGPLVHVAHGLYGITDNTAAGWMVNRGLLGIADYFTGVMPREPAIALRGGRVFLPFCLRQPELVLAEVDPGMVDSAAAERASRVVADIVAIGDLWSAEPPSVLKAGGIGLRDIRRAAKAIDRTEVEAARVIELAGVAGLARADPLTGRAAPTDAYDQWLALESPDRWAWLATDWLASEFHLYMAGAISSKDKPIPPLLTRAPELNAIRRRRLVVALLEEAAPGRAPAPASIREVVTWTNPAAWSGGPASVTTLVSWVQEEAGLLGLTGLGALSTAGRAAMAGDPSAAAVALAALVPPAVADFVIQADLTAVIAGEPAATVRAELDLLADIESKGAATVYRFSEGSIRRAFDAGHSATDIVEFLGRHATRGVPQPLTYLIADLGRRFGNVRVGAATSYLRSDDPTLLAEVLQARATSKLRLRLIAPTVLVTDADPATVTSTLQAAGYLPARESADGALLLARPPTLRVPAAASPTWSAPAPPDVADIVADLRRPPQVTPARVAPGGLGSDDDTDAWLALFDLGRPTEIAKDSRSIRTLLTNALDGFWLVRLSYTQSNGRAEELTVEPTDVDRRHLHASCLPRGNQRRFVVDMIEWAHVLTEAEEELV